MNLRYITLMLVVPLGCARAAEGQLHATLEAQTNRPGWFLIHVTNLSSNTVRLLDVTEGSGFCGDLYEVTFEKDGKRSSSQGECFYAPGIDPTVLEIRPGQSYNRELQPVAYVRAAEHATAEQLAVTYRVSQRVRESWLWIRELGADLSLTFTARKASGAAANDTIKAIEGYWVDWKQTNTSLIITSTNLTILANGATEVWAFVPSTNRLDTFASRNGVTNRMFFAEGDACEKVVFFGDRRWFVNHGKAPPENGTQPIRPATNQLPSSVAP
jgi:hypothetical protein